MSSIPRSAPDSEPDDLAGFIREHPRLAVLTGAGISTDSGIPDYRDDEGNWKHRQPMQYSDFVNDASMRRKYWAQSFSGWQRISGAQPNAAHRALATLEHNKYLSCVITQNVDNLHRAAGSQEVIDLHGVLQHTRCLDCGVKGSRSEFQNRLRESNPDWTAATTAIAPDGDARLSVDTFESFEVPGCDVCGGVVKPDVVFFGEAIPQSRSMDAQRIIEESSALLVIGSSLMVFSGYRFARLADESGKPIAIVNRGTTRADALAAIKMTAGCAELLTHAVRRLVS